MSASVTIDLSAYAKIFLHAAKYPSCPVVGLLVGSNDSGNTITQTIPALHSPPVGPTLDIAVSSVTSNQKILGVYFSNDRSDSDTWPHYINKIIKGLQASNGSCLVIQMKNSLLENLDSFCFMGTQSGHSVKIEVANDASPRYVNEMLDTLVTEKLHRKFQDLEDHMDSAHTERNGGDFRNSFVEECVRSYVVNNVVS